MRIEEYIPNEVLELALDHIYQDRDENLRHFLWEMAQQRGTAIWMNPVPREEALETLEPYVWETQDFSSPKPDLVQIMREFREGDQDPESAYQAVKKALGMS